MLDSFVLQHIEVKESSGPTLLIKDSFFSTFSFTGTIYVNDDEQDGYIGIVFNYWSNRKYVLVAWSKGEGEYTSSTPFVSMRRKGILVKVINSSSGPGPIMRNALWHSGNVTNEVNSILCY